MQNTVLYSSFHPTYQTHSNIHPSSIHPCVRSPVSNCISSHFRASPPGCELRAHVQSSETVLCDSVAQGVHRLQDVSSEAEETGKAGGGASSGTVAGTGEGDWLGGHWGDGADGGGWGDLGDDWDGRVHVDWGSWLGTVGEKMCQRWGVRGY